MLTALFWIRNANNETSTGTTFEAHSALTTVLGFCFWLSKDSLTLNVLVTVRLEVLDQGCMHIESISPMALYGSCGTLNLDVQQTRNENFQLEIAITT